MIFNRDTLPQYLCYKMNVKLFLASLLADLTSINVSRTQTIVQNIKKMKFCPDSNASSNAIHTFIKVEKQNNYKRKSALVCQPFYIDWMES